MDSSIDQQAVMAKILIVEDDQELAEELRDWLVHDRYAVDVAHRGADAENFYKAFEYDVLILDWELPDVSGIEVLRTFRANGGKSAVLMLTGKKELSDKERGLDSGADDYLTKPFEFREISARIRALMRRPAVFAGTKLQAGDLELETDVRKVTRGGQPVLLSPQEFALLELFMRYPNRVFTHDVLLNRIWASDSTASVEMIRTCIKELRKKLGTDIERSPIRTVHGVGYKLELE
jgi:DNA-binding response OmpR family regulator